MADRILRQHALGEEAVTGPSQGDPGAGDRSGAGAGVGLDHIAVDEKRALAQCLHIENGPETATDEALDLLRSAGEFHQFSGLSLRRRTGKQSIFSREPAAMAAPAPAGHVLLQGNAAENSRSARAHDQGTQGEGHRIPVHGERAQLCRSPAVSPRGRGCRHQRMSADPKPDRRCRGLMERHTMDGV